MTSAWSCGMTRHLPRYDFTPGLALGDFPLLASDFRQGRGCRRPTRKSGPRDLHRVFSMEGTPSTTSVRSQAPDALPTENPSCRTRFRFRTVSDCGTPFVISGFCVERLHFFAERLHFFRENEAMYRNDPKELYLESLTWTEDCRAQRGLR